MDEKVSLPDQCTNYNNLTSSTRRYDYQGSKSDWKCDRTGHRNQSPDWNGNGWYRIQDNAGTRISAKLDTSTRGECGTNRGGHLIGEHPILSAGETFKQKVCFWQGYCQDSSFTRVITITNCGTYYVYYLTIISGCNYGYCTE